MITLLIWYIVTVILINLLLVLYELFLINRIKYLRIKLVGYKFLYDVDNKGYPSRRQTIAFKTFENYYFSSASESIIGKDDKWLTLKGVGRFFSMIPKTLLIIISTPLLLIIALGMLIVHKNLREELVYDFKENLLFGDKIKRIVKLKAEIAAYIRRGITQEEEDQIRKKLKKYFQKDIKFNKELL